MRFRIAAVGGLVVLVALAIGGYVWIHHGFSARDQPSAVETILARQMRSLAVPSSAKSARNPIPLTPEVLTEARAHFADHCATCHANDGSGNTDIGKNLYPKAPDMRLAHTQDLTDGEIYYIIHNGVRLTGMPAWGADDSDEDSWKLVHFIRDLPALTPDEIREMESLNPKSPGEMAEEQEDQDFLNGTAKSEQGGTGHPAAHTTTTPKHPKGR